MAAQGVRECALPHVTVAKKEVLPDEGNMRRLAPAYSPVTEKAKTIAGGCIAQARRGTTSGPKGCGQEVRN